MAEGQYFTISIFSKAIKALSGIDEVYSTADFKLLITLATGSHALPKFQEFLPVSSSRIHYSV